jgi:hypothetical protein
MHHDISICFYMARPASGKDRMDRTGHLQSYSPLASFQRRKGEHAEHIITFCFCRPSVYCCGLSLIILPMLATVNAQLNSGRWPSQGAGQASRVTPSRVVKHTDYQVGDCLSAAVMVSCQHAVRAGAQLSAEAMQAVEAYDRCVVATRPTCPAVFVPVVLSSMVARAWCVSLRTNAEGFHTHVCTSLTAVDNGCHCAHLALGTVGFTK